MVCVKFQIYHKVQFSQEEFPSITVSLTEIPGAIAIIFMFSGIK